MNEKIILKKFAERFSELVKNSSIDIQKLADMLGIKSKSTIYRYMNGEMAPKIPMVKYASEIFNVNPLWLMGLDSPMERQIKEETFSNSKQYYMCPVYGRISAGIPNWVEECIEGRIPIDPELMNILNPEECFFLRVNGESMNKEIKNGAYALIRKQEAVENGEIAVVLVNGYDATLKKFSKQGDIIILEPMSNDPSFSVQIYNKETEITVIGKYIGKMEMK